MSPSPQGYRQPWEEPSPEREVFDEMLRRPYEELHAENQRLRDALLEYGRHKPRCPATWPGEPAPCECGLMTALGADA